MVTRKELCFFMELMMKFIEAIGIISFAISGATMGIKKKADPFGAVVLAVVTATGGGITRDIFLGRLPPASFLDTGYISTAALTGVGVFFVAKNNKHCYEKNLAILDTVNNVFDALGLGVFTAMGTYLAITCGFSRNTFFAIFIGVLTGIGGGFIRDIMLREIPFVLQKHFYALASIAGAFIFYSLYMLHIPETPSLLVSASVTFVLRMLATHYKWNIPPAI